MELFIVLVYGNSQGCCFGVLEAFVAVYSCFLPPPPKSLNGSLEIVIWPNTSFPFLKVNALCSVSAYQRPFSLLDSGS